MIVHSDGIGSTVFFFVMLASGATFLAVFLFAAGGHFRRAGQILGWWSACAAGYIALTMTVALLAPQKTVNPGQSYCVDIWCISIQKVTKTPFAQDIAYRADVRILSDADRVKTSAKGFSLYLVDEQHRRFPLIADPSATPFDIELSPRQSVNTSLRFVAAADAQQLFLQGDGPSLWITKFFIGDDSSLLHRPTLLRVQ